SEGSATKAGLAVVDSAIDTYRTSVKFYGEMRDRVATVADQIRDPADDETVAMLVTDRHDNIGMDPVAEAVADAGQASLVIDMGDDTSTGGSWEAFSINSLGRAFEDYDKIGIAGNHDTGGFVQNALRDVGFTVLDGEPVDVDGIRFIGDSDPRSSGLTAGYGDTAGETIQEQGARLTKAACEDGRVSTVVVHSPTTGEQIAQSGCVDLVVSGHLHRQVGPVTLTSPEGRRTVTYTNASTGGAVYAFALGSKLRRPAQVTLVTYRDGRPVGLQPVDFEPGGEVSVQDYIALDLDADGEGPKAARDTGKRH
ncbi:MAG: metallophosphoesterase family protein, partial [Nocardioidaceae bacterium]